MNISEVEELAVDMLDGGVDGVQTGQEASKHDMNLDQSGKHFQHSDSLLTGSQQVHNLYTTGTQQVHTSGTHRVRNRYATGTHWEHTSM